jgi:astacin
VAYELDPGLPEAQRQAALGAMRAWNREAGVSFAPRDGQQDYVVFRPGVGTCHSNVGMVGGGQEVVLSEGCMLSQATHEVGHALGLWHEQQRADRDLYVSVHLDRLADQQYASNYDRVRGYSPPVRYDYDSIMHYGSHDFGNGGLVIERLSGDPDIEPPGEITRWDVEKVRRLYRLDGQPSG